MFVFGPLAVSAFGCFHAMINSLAILASRYLVGALLGIYRKRFAQTTLAIQCFLACCFGFGGLWGVSWGWALPFLALSKTPPVLLRPYFQTQIYQLFPHLRIILTINETEKITWTFQIEQYILVNFGIV